MRFIARSIFVLSCAMPAFGQSPLPQNAVIIERQAIPVSAHPNRELVLWMEHPVKHDKGPLDSDLYACPEWTTGSGYYEGPTRISLMDTRSGAEINRIHLTYPDSADTDSFMVPFRIARGFWGRLGFYEVPGPIGHLEGKPKLLTLKDYNGDGQALEAAFFVAEACMGLPTTLIGYSIKQDRVIQYEADLAGYDGPQKWIDYLFAKKPVRPGYWKYAIDYSGRCGDADGDCIERFEIQYDPATERFKSVSK
jgi:hypothetical protein